MIKLLKITHKNCGHIIQHTNKCQLKNLIFVNKQKGVHISKMSLKNKIISYVENVFHVSYSNAKRLKIS